MGELIAKREFYYDGHRYIPGEEVICKDPEMIGAWLRAESVEDRGQAPEAGKEEENPKNLAENTWTATPAAAEAGIPVEEGRMAGKPPRAVGRRKVTFKEAIQDDVKGVFLNPEEFGEIHKLNQKDVLIIVDENELTEREKRMKGVDGELHSRQLLIYVRQKISAFFLLPGKC